MRVKHKYILYLGLILFLLGLAMSTGLVSLTIVKQPFDVKVTPMMNRITWVWEGDKLTIDLTNVNPSNNYFNGAPVHYNIYLDDWKQRPAGKNWVFDGFSYGVSIYSDGKVEVTATNAPFLTPEMKGIDQPDSLAGVIVIWRGDLSVGKIVFDMDNHVIRIGDIKTIPMLSDFSPSEVGVGGPTNPPVYSGYIHLYGGYMIKQVRETTAQTHTISNNPVTTTTMIHEPVTTTVNGETHVVVATPIPETPTVDHAEYGMWLTIAGAVMILLALL